MLGAALVEVADQQVRAAGVAHRADLGQRVGGGHRASGAALAQVVAVRVDQAGPVLGWADHTPDTSTASTESAFNTGPAPRSTYSSTAIRARPSQHVVTSCSRTIWSRSVSEGCLRCGRCHLVGADLVMLARTWLCTEARTPRQEGESSVCPR